MLKTTPFRRLMWFLPVLVAAVAGASYAMLPGLRGSAEGPESSGGGVPVVDDPSMQAALASASSRTGIEPRLPTFLPTSADRLVWVDWSTGPPGVDGGLHLIELVYQAEEPVVIDGHERRPLLELFLLEVRLSNPNGELIDSDAAGYELYYDLVGVDAAGDPVAGTYMALSADATIVMAFTAEVPDVADVERMLASFAPAP
jgi:hypothetical protein